MSIYAVSDLHGQYRLFTRLLKQIEFSKEDTMYILGDIIDRGPNSIKLLQYIMKRPNIKCLIGNHEHMMWAHYWGNIPPFNDAWLIPNNGGIKTKEQYDQLSEKEQNEIYEYINNMYLQVEVNINDTKFLLSHSSFLPQENTIKWIDHKDSVERVTWRSPWRMWEYQSPEYYLHDKRLHIIGHVPVQVARNDEIKEPYKLDIEEIEKRINVLQEVTKDNIINIDGGCAIKATKRLSNCGIICMNLTNYAYNKDKVFVYMK